MVVHQEHMLRMDTPPSLSKYVVILDPYVSAHGKPMLRGQQAKLCQPSFVT